jgi:hypothetical protein
VDPLLKDVVALNPEEYEQLDALITHVSTDKGIGTLIRRAFSSVFSNAGVQQPNQYGLLSYWKKLFPNSSLNHEVSMVSSHRLATMRVLLKAGEVVGIPDFDTPSQGFSSAQWSPDMFDILSIPHLRRQDGAFGVFQTGVGAAPPVQCMVVNLPVYIGYLSREDRYSAIGKYHTLWSQTLAEDIIRDKLVGVWMSQYPLMVENELKPYIHYSHIWPSEHAGDVYVIPMDILEQYRQVSRSMEAVRRARKKGTKKREGVRTPRLGRVIQMSSPAIADAGGAVFSLRVMFRNGEVYFSPVWEYDLEPDFLLSRNYVSGAEEPRLKDGVFRNELTREYYYTLGRYLAFEDTPLVKYPQLTDWFNQNFSKMRREEFRYMYRHIKANAEVNAFVPYNPTKRPCIGTLPFSVEEDILIRKELRPANVSALMVKINEINSQRTRKEVLARGASLRDSMIEDGEYNLQKLPHVNYNALLGKRLKELREQKERNLNAQKVAATS